MGMGFSLVVFSTSRGGNKLGLIHGADAPLPGVSTETGLPERTDGLGVGTNDSVVLRVVLGVAAVGVEKEKDFFLGGSRCIVLVGASCPE